MTCACRDGRLNGRIKNIHRSVRVPSPRTRHVNVGRGDRGSNRAKDMKQSYLRGDPVSSCFRVLGGELHHDIKLRREVDRCLIFFLLALSYESLMIIRSEKYKRVRFAHI